MLACSISFPLLFVLTFLDFFLLYAYRQRRWLKSKCSQEVDPMADPELLMPDSEAEAGGGWVWAWVGVVFLLHYSLVCVVSCLFSIFSIFCRSSLSLAIHCSRLPLLDFCHCFVGLETRAPGWAGQAPWICSWIYGFCVNGPLFRCGFGSGRGWGYGFGSGRGGCWGCVAYQLPNLECING